MAKMKAVQVVEANGPLEVVERDVPEPPEGHVLIKVQACGICHSDSLTKEGLWPGLQFPRVLGHEIAGVEDWQQGQRVGVGWHGGIAATARIAVTATSCFARRRSSQASATTAATRNTWSRRRKRWRASPTISPTSMPPRFFARASPRSTHCATAARAGDVVAVLGIGGLGHLGVQFARKMGFETVAIARGQDKAPLAKQLGAHHYIDSESQNVAEALQALGGARVILATATSGKAMSATIGGLGLNGKLIMVGVSDEPVEVPITQFIMGRNSVQGWPSGTAADSQDTLAFSALSGVRPMIEEYPLSRAAEAYDRMMSGKARFRVVLMPGK